MISPFFAFESGFILVSLITINTNSFPLAWLTAADFVRSAKMKGKWEKKSNTSPEGLQRSSLLRQQKKVTALMRSPEPGGSWRFLGCISRFQRFFGRIQFNLCPSSRCCIDCLFERKDLLNIRRFLINVGTENHSTASCQSHDFSFALIRELLIHERSQTKIDSVLAHNLMTLKEKRWDRSASISFRGSLKYWSSRRMFFFWKSWNNIETNLIQIFSLI